MRALLALIVLGGCGASVLTGSGLVKPAVTPALSELPADAGRRDGVLDSAHYQPGPEQHGTLTPKERRVETAAATAAAWIGALFSTTQNVTLGGEMILDPVTPVRPKARSEQSEDGKATPPEERAASDGLVPWIRLQPQSPRPESSRPE